MRTERKVIAVMMILTMWFSFASCDSELTEDTASPEVVTPVDSVGNSGNDGNTKNENRPIIENQVFTETATFYGHENDSLVIRNCTFENINGEGLILGDVDEVIVEDCTFRNITGNAVRFATTRTSNNIRIENNEIYDIDNCGILTQEGHVHVNILNNRIYRVALNAEKGPHGIYLIGKDFLVEGNTIHDVGSGPAAGITTRTYGKISRNKIYNVTGSGIDYSSDHPGYGGKLLIENNIIYDNDRKGIHLMGGPADSKIGSAIIRFNTVLSNNDEMAVWVDSGYYMDATFEVYGNILINTSGAENYLFVSPQHALDFEGYNLTGTKDMGFVDFEGRNLHITSTSDAVNYVDGATDYPEYDFDGSDLREQVSQDAGADEI
ncbi:right-handed parallel beta-helix repeat-containing protein [Ancylomarina longa]|nr:right-handed parallel beta-helix repeat-containing protein [Ancylomarina longa]